MPAGLNGKFYGTTFIPGKEYSPSHAIITRDAVRELARQLDPPNDCPYCKGGDGQSNKALINNCDDVLAYFDGRVLRIETFTKNWDPTDVECSAMYCLKCGRKLEAKP